MAAQDESNPKSIQQIADELGYYPVEAFQFVSSGCAYAVRRVHGNVKIDPKQPQHISGQELCEGLREVALRQWGLLARTVLKRWNITSTLDFGRIVYALIRGGQMDKTENDSLEDFRDVFDFRTAFEGDYKIEQKR